MFAKQITVLGVKIHSTSKKQVLTDIGSQISEGKKFKIFTPNPEILLLAQKELEFKNILNSADYLIPDGVGLKFASIFLGQGNINIIKGRELMIEIIGSLKGNKKIFLLGARSVTNEKAVKVLSQKYQNLKFQGDGGLELDGYGNPVSKKYIQVENDIIKKINTIKPDLLFVAYGAPKQERWVVRWFEKLDVGGIMVVGGALDYLTGGAKLSPKWLDDLGLEWLWRLFTQPKRIIRILNATIIFPIKIIESKFNSHG